MRVPLLLLLLAGLFTACTTQPAADLDGPILIKAPEASVPKDFQWVYYDYGELREPYYAKAQDSVWARYGVGNTGFGCVVTETLIHDIKLHNDSLFALLQPKYPGLHEDRILTEMQDYVATQKSIEGVIASYVKRHLPYAKGVTFYPNTDWWPMDTAGTEYGVKVTFQDGETGRPEGSSLNLKVMPATGDYLVRNAAGNWVEQ